MLVGCDGLLRLLHLEARTVLLLFLLLEVLGHQLLMHRELEAWRSDVPHTILLLLLRDLIVHDLAIGNPSSWVDVCFDLLVDDALLELSH